MARSRKSPASSARRPAAPWARLKDAELKAMRFSDLKLRIEDSPLAPAIERLYRELERKGLQFRPHCWLAEEWFSPDGIPGIAIPFYLTHARLKRLERRMTREVEGGNINWLMRLLRHEAGHAIDTAFRLRRRADWRAVFGPASLPYPKSYKPRAGSRRFVQHLGAWYAQSHPTEDFAETFAVWLKPGSPWRREYAEWPALKKLEYVDGLMRDLKGRRPPVRGRQTVDALHADRRTLAEHYETRLALHSGRAHMMDHFIRRVFAQQPGSRNTPRAAVLLRRHKNSIVQTLAKERGLSQYLVHQVLRLVIQRCETLALYVRGPQGRALPAAQRLVRRIVRLQLAGGASRQPL